LQTSIQKNNQDGLEVASSSIRGEQVRSGSLQLSRTAVDLHEEPAVSAVRSIRTEVSTGIRTKKKFQIFGSKQEDELSTHTSLTSILWRSNDALLLLAEISNVRHLRVSLSDNELEALNSREELRQQQVHSAIHSTHLELQVGGGGGPEGGGVEKQKFPLIQEHLLTGRGFYQRFLMVLFLQKLIQQSHPELLPWRQELKQEVSSAEEAGTCDIPENDQSKLRQNAPSQ
ncbi:hypothetical protein GOODEAATRI_024183, partial [Goodea atripinnis]